MPSTNKTAYLELNAWSGSDKPKMADFNTDNQKVDAGVKALNTSLTAHIASALVHLTTADKQKLSQVMTLETTSYTGNGALSRKIPLAAKPKLGLIFAVGKPMFEYNAYAYYLKQNASVFSDLGCPQDLRLDSDGIYFSFSTTPSPDGNCLSLNENGVQYVVITVR